MRPLFAILALLFFCTPVGLRMVGVTADPFENRRLADPPKVSAGWDVFDQATRFFVDRLPLREQAVRANTWVALNVFDSPPDYGRNAAGGNAERDALPFGEPSDAAKATEPGRPTPAPGREGDATEVQPGVTVLRGRDGWLFLQEEFSRACIRFVDFKTALERYERLVSIIRASGRRVVFAVPPDKSTIYPEFLPASYADQACSGPGRDELWNAVEGARRREVLGLREAMLAVKAPPPEHTYLINDTHWNSKGAVLAVGALLERLGGPVQLRDDEIERGRAEQGGDLSNLLGAPETHDVPAWKIERDVPPAAAEQRTLPEGGVLAIQTHAGSDAPMLPGRTLFVYDSFGVGMLAPLEAYSRELASLQWYSTLPGDTIEAIAGADTVILEKVERDLNFLASDQGYVTPGFLDALTARLNEK